MKKIALVATLLAGLSPVGTAFAQQPLPGVSVEIRAGLPIPLQGLRQTDGEFANPLRPKDSVGGRAILHATPALDLYLAYTRNRFRVEGFGDVGLDDEGIDVGLRAALPGVAGLTPRIGGAVVRHSATVVGEGSPRTRDDALGFEVAGEVEVPVFGSLTATPGVSLVRYYSVGEFGWSDVTYLKTDVGVRYRL